MAIKEVSPQEAYETLKDDPNGVYLDVRTVEEFAAGHADGAVNVPIAFHDPAQGMVLNEDFLPVVLYQFPKSRKLVVGCQAGPRSNRAADLLQEAGYTDVVSIRGGFGGQRDQLGNVVAPGWAELGLPVSQDNGAGTSYESLAAVKH